MILLCPACGASREIAGEALRSDGLARCEFCRTIFDPRRQAPQAQGDQQGEGSGGAPQPEAPRDRWYVEVTSGVYGPAPLRVLERWIREGRMDWEDLVSQDGGPWLPALEQRSLVEDFQAREEKDGGTPTGGPPLDADDRPPVKTRPPEVTPERVKRSVAVVAAGLLLVSALTLNLPGLVIGVGLLAMRRWALTAGLVLLSFLVFLFFGGAIWALSREAWWGAVTGLALIGGATAAGTTLLRPPVRASFRPGGGVGAFVGLALSIPLTAILVTGVWSAYQRHLASRQVVGDAYGYTLIRPSRAWIPLASPRPLEGHPRADLELIRRDGRARLLVVVEEERGDADDCLARVGERIKSTGRDPTVYQVQQVSAGGLLGAQEIVSVERGDGRISSLITCYSLGGQHYQVLGVAKEGDFDEVRPALARLATSFRPDPADDPLRLDIHTRTVDAGPSAVAAPGSLAAVVSRSETAVVLITAHLPDKKRGYGSGALLREDGLIVTNYHVIEGARKIMVGISGHGTRRASLVATDPATDLVILKAPGRDLPFLTLAADPVRAGDDVIAIGSPMGLMHTVTKGIISSTRRTRNRVDYLQTDVSINPGSSGGPLLNLQGEVVGINTFIVRESEAVALTGLNFAVPARYLREMAERNRLSLPSPPSRTAATIAPEG